MSRKELFILTIWRKPTPQALEILRRYAAEVEAETLEDYSRQIRFLSRSEFAEDLLWLAGVNARALIVGFNLPFDLSRLAIDNRTARDRNEGWSMVMFQDRDPESGDVRENPFRPRIIITPKDSKAAFIRFAGISMRSKETKQRLIPYFPGFFQDLRTFGWALRNKSYSLQSACKDFGVPGKLDHVPTGRVSEEEIEYCCQDVRATVGLLNAMRTEFDQASDRLATERCFLPGIHRQSISQRNEPDPAHSKIHYSRRSSWFSDAGLLWGTSRGSDSAHASSYCSHGFHVRIPYRKYIIRTVATSNRKGHEN